jgi:hypothetical protein
MSTGDLGLSEPPGGHLRLAHMHDRWPSRVRGISLVLAVMVIAVAGCSSAAAPPSSSTPSQPAGIASSSPPPAAIDPNTPIGTDLPPGGGDPGAGPGAGRIVVPRPGQLDVHPISAQTLTAVVDERHVVIAIDYTSGVEPCYILDSILVQPRAGAFAITLREGHGPQDVMCIEMAEFKRALVDLGDLEPGTYTISDTTGGASPISVTVN